MTTKNVADRRRSISIGATRYLVSMAVAAAIGGAALPQRALAADATADQTTAPATASAADEQVTEVTITGSRPIRRASCRRPPPPGYRARRAARRIRSA